MGKDGNTIEIEIDAAATVAAATAASNANAKLEMFTAALVLFDGNIKDITTTTNTISGLVENFNTSLQKFADNLTTNLADMQTSVVQKIEPHLERELENMVNRVLNKVEAKTGTTGESRSRSEAKQGAAAPAVPVTPAGQRVGVSQDTDYKKPDYRIKENIVERIVADFDEVTGKQIERIHTTRNTRVIKDDHDQFEDEEGNLVDKTSTVTTFTSEINKVNKVIAEGAKVEKDRGIAIRKEITGALIGLHVMKVVSQYSQVANAGFMMIFSALGHLLNNILLPMMPAFIIFAQVLHTVANVIQMLPMPIRQLIGALLIWKATSMLIAAMPIKDIVDGMRGLVGSMKDAGSGLKGFLNLVRAFIDFMNSGQGKGAVSWVGSGLAKVGGAVAGGAKKLLHRARGGPVLGHGAYIVGEKGPEIFVPKTSGAIIPNHKIGREAGTPTGASDVVPADTPTVANPISGIPFDMGSLIGPLVGGSLGALAGGWVTGGPIGAAIGGVGGALAGGNMAALPGLMGEGIGMMAGSPIFQGIVGAMNVLAGTISSVFAPLAPIMGMMGAIGGLASGLKKGFGGGADMTPVVKAIQNTSYAEQSAIGKGHRGSNNILSLIYILLQGFGGIIGGIFKKLQDIIKKPPDGGGSSEPPPVTIPTKWGNPGPLTIPAITTAIIGTAWGLLHLGDLKIPSIPPVTVPIKWGDLPGINITQIPTVTIPVNWDALPPIVPTITTVVVPLIWGTLSALSIPRLTAVIVPVIWGTLSKLNIPAIPAVVVSAVWGTLSRLTVPQITPATVPVRWGTLIPFVVPALTPVIIPVIWGKLTGLPSTGVDVNVSPRINVQTFTSVLSTLISAAFSNAWSSWKERISAEEGDPEAEDRAWRERIRNMAGEMNGVFAIFINALKTTLAAGVPIDIKIDVDSVTQTVQTVVDTIVSGVNGEPAAPVRPPGSPVSDPVRNPPEFPSPGTPITPPTIPTVPVGPPTDIPVPIPGPTVPPVTTEPPAATDLTSIVTNILGAAGLMGLVGYVVNMMRTLPSAALGTALTLAGIPANIIARLMDVQPEPATVPMAMAFGGTLVPNVPTMVGERGPELIIPAGTGTVIPNNKLGSIGSGGGGGQPVQITQHFHVTTNNPRELTDTVMKELKMELARVKM